MTLGVSPQAESSAVSTDILTASQAIESARNAHDVATTVTFLQQAVQALGFAKNAYIASNGFNTPALVQQVDVTIATIQNVIASQASWGDLATYQNTTLYGLQDYIWRLSSDANYVGARDSVIDFWGVFGFIFLVIGAVSYRQYQADVHGRPLNGGLYRHR